MPRIDTETSLKILARIARGDTYKEISDAMGIAIMTISDLKKRNQSALETIQSRMLDHQVSTSKKILDKAHGLIEKKLDKATKADEYREELKRQLDAGELDIREYSSLMNTVYEPTLTELNAISKESFNQSQIEQGKPTSIGSGSHDTTEQLTALVQALNAGDEVELYKMVLNPSQKALETPDETILEGELVI